MARNDIYYHLSDRLKTISTGNELILSENQGILYICPTPIGNLEDMTLRAIRILKEVDLIACEDTRLTQKLLNRYEITTKSTSYHKFSEKNKTNYIINLLNEGNNIALVSDAGTPQISDPGMELVKQAYENNIKIVPLPGATALTTALSAVSLEIPHFAFFGFLPRNKKEKEELILKHSELNIVAYESPSRLVKTLEELMEILGNRVAVVARELTKIYEEFKHDKLENLIDYYKNNPPKGEIVLIVEGIKSKKVEPEEQELLAKIKDLKNAGYKTKDISKILAALTNYSKSKIYELSLQVSETHSHVDD